DKVLSRLKAIRGGKLNTAEFGSRMRGEGIFADQIRDLFRVSLKKVGLAKEGPELSTAHFRRPGGVQLDLL
ncbi:MAG TPA: radical SAM protein, partial [Verrucomicrobiales bacterium]|nr:radical SAM protein [Verrucomicrobiales bacterium]